MSVESDAVSNFILDSAKDMAGSLLSGFASQLGATIFASIFGPSESQVPAYFEKVFKRIDSIVKDQLLLENLRKTKIQLNGARSYMTIEYANEKADKKASKSSLIEHLDHWNLEFVGTIIPTLESEELKAAGLELFFSAASMHLAILQEMALVDENHPNNPLNSPYAKDVSDYATLYIEKGTKVFNDGLNAYLLKNPFTPISEQFNFLGHYNVSKEEHDLSIKATYSASKGDPLRSIVAKWQTLVVLPLAINHETINKFKTYSKLVLHAVSFEKKIIAMANDANSNGVNLGDFSLKLLTKHQINIWQGIMFQIKSTQDGFKPLGDAAHNNGYDKNQFEANNYISAINSGQDYTKPWSNYSMLFKPNKGKENLFAAPDRFVWVTDDKDSGKSQNVNYYVPITPAGYQAIGCVFVGGGQPDVNNYWCVSTKLTTPAVSVSWLVDAGWGFKHHNGDLSRPSYPLTTTLENALKQNTNMAFVPQVVLQSEGLQLPPVVIHAGLSNQYKTNATGTVAEHSLPNAELLSNCFSAAATPVERQLNSTEIFLNDQTRPQLVNVLPIPYFGIVDEVALAGNYICPWYFVTNEVCYELISYAKLDDNGLNFKYETGTDAKIANEFSMHSGIDISPEHGFTITGRYNNEERNVFAGYGQDDGSIKIAPHQRHKIGMFAAIGDELFKCKDNDYKSLPMEYYGPLTQKQYENENEGIIINSSEHIAVWQLIHRISVVRDEGTILATVDFRSDELKIIPELKIKYAPYHSKGIPEGPGISPGKY